MSELGLRQAYNTIKDAYKAKGRNPVTTASDLRLIVPITTTRTTFEFPVIVGDDQNNYPDAILLNRADAFTATEIGLFIGRRNGASIAAQVANTQFDWYSYTNSTQFNVTASDYIGLKPLFNAGNINATINNVQYLQNFSTLRMKRGLSVQDATLFATGGTATIQDSYNGEKDGFYPLVPTLQLSGTSKIVLSISVPQALPIATAATAQYCIMLAFRGFLSLGASNLNK